MNHKVIYLGFHKTGTSSMSRLFRQIGLNVCPDYSVKNWNDADGPRRAMELSRSFNGFRDNPWPLLYKEFDKEFRGCRFVFYERNEDNWYKSLLRHFGKKRNKMRAYIYGVGFGCPHGNERKYKEVYKKHSKDVREHFKGRSESFLEIEDLSNQSAVKIGEFLKCKHAAELVMPHINVRQGR